MDPQIFDLLTYTVSTTYLYIIFEWIPPFFYILFNFYPTLNNNGEIYIYKKKRKPFWMEMSFNYTYIVASSVLLAIIFFHEIQSHCNIKQYNQYMSKINPMND